MDAIRKLGCSFLFAFFHSNYGRICSRLWDIQHQRMVWPWKHGNGTIWEIAYEFLLAFHNNYGAILHRLRDVASYWSKSRNFYTAPVFSATTGGDSVGISRRCLKTTVRWKTRSSAVAKRPSDASCLYSFNTKHRAQSFIISCFRFRYTTAYN